MILYKSVGFTYLNLVVYFLYKETLHCSPEKNPTTLEYLMVNLSVLKELSLAKNPDFRIHISLETKTLDISNYKYDNLSLKVSMVYIIWFRRYKYEAI